MTVPFPPAVALAALLRSEVGGGDIAADTMAGYVLRAVGEVDPRTRRRFPRPGSFWASLVDAAFLADPVNRAHLGAGFPGLMAMVHAYTDLPAGRDALLYLATNYPTQGATE